MEGNTNAFDLAHIKAFQAAMQAADGKAIAKSWDVLRFRYGWTYNEMRQCAQDANIDRWDFEDLMQLADASESQS